MTLVQSPNPLQATNTVALNALGPGARAASVTAVLGPNLPSLDITVDHLPPGQDLGALGSIYADATGSNQPLFVTFPDTGAQFEVFAGAAVWLLAVTGLRRFTISAPGLAQLTAFQIQVLNVVVPPTGEQPVVGSVTVTGGTFQVSNPGPAAGPATSRSQNIPAAASTTLMGGNAGRKFLMFQMPQASDGWVNFLGGAAAPNAADCFYLGAGQPWNSGIFVPTEAVEIYLTNGGMVPAIEG